MKKVFAMLIVFMMICSILTACGGESAPKSEDPGAVKEEPTAISEGGTEIGGSAVVDGGSTTAGGGSTATDGGSTEVEQPKDTTPVSGTLDIIAIDAGSGVGITASGGAFSVPALEYDGVVCECLTAQNETAWLYITPDQYRSVFNDVTFNKGSNWVSDASCMLYVCPETVRVNVMIHDADTFVAGLSKEINDDTVMAYLDAESAPSNAVDEVLYSNDTAAMTSAYTKIVSIVPEQFLFPATSVSGVATDVVCLATTTTGDEVHIVMSVSDYYDHVDATAPLEEGRFSTATVNEVTFDTPLTIHGVSYSADSIITDLSTEIGCDVVLWFRSV